MIFNRLTIIISTWNASKLREWNRWVRQIIVEIAPLKLLHESRLWIRLPLHYKSLSDWFSFVRSLHLCHKSHKLLSMIKASSFIFCHKIFHAKNLSRLMDLRRRERGLSSDKVLCLDCVAWNRCKLQRSPASEICTNECSYV